MRYFGSLGTFIILMSSLLFLSKAWSSEIVSKQLGPENQSGLEAIVTKVEQDSLTLKPTNNDNGEISIPRKDDGTIHIGDKIVLQDEKLRKIEDGSADSFSHDEKGAKETGTLSNTP